MKRLHLQYCVILSERHIFYKFVIKKVVQNARVIFISHNYFGTNLKRTEITCLLSISRITLTFINNDTETIRLLFLFFLWASNNVQTCYC